MKGCTPARAILNVDAFTNMVNTTDEDFELAEDEGREDHQNAAYHVLDAWLVTIDAPEAARVDALGKLRWRQ
jgi:hypothetical protein